MAVAKKNLNKTLSEKIIFTFLVIFPLGQLIRLDFKLLGINVTLQPIDLIVGIALILFLTKSKHQPEIFKYIYSFFAAAVFSLLFSLTFFETKYVFIGSLYLLRLCAYAGFFGLVINLARKKSIKIALFNALIAVTVFTAIFGWIQYLWLPDLRFLKYVGWDDHLYRLVGTFLDPGFTGIILVLGFLAAFVKFIETKKRKLIPILLLLLVTTVFTYARASFLALFGGLMVVLVVKKKLKISLWPLILLLVMLPLLPRPPSEGAKLERVNSIYQKIQNYSQTISIIEKQPLFGVGYNNLCAARMKYFKIGGYGSHGCSGSDSSLLFVLAATGVVGLLIFLHMSFQALKGVKRDLYGITFLICSGALFIHSLFVNSLFYPWVMGWMGILLALALRNSKTSE